MNPDFWKGRWERGEIGWHQTEVEPGLITHFGDLKPTRVLVPLCGKSLDLAWLASQGHEVLGVELSELAVRSFFSEQGLSPTVSARGKLTAYTAGSVTILQGDFFDLSPGDLAGPIGALYDRAALIALPQPMRARYAAHLSTLVRRNAASGFTHLQLVLERTPHDEEGPPHSVPETEIRALYGALYQITCLGRELLNEDGERRIEECTYRMTLS